mgnify:CR=1 FL=1
MPLKIAAEEIEAAKSEKGGWTRTALAQLGVPWPPPKGWKESLIAGTPLAQQIFSTKALRGRHSKSLESKILQRVVMAIIDHGHGDILKEMDDVMAYYGSKLPTIEQVIGGRPKNAIIEGSISFDDKVYRFSCARRAQPQAHT